MNIEEVKDTFDPNIQPSSTISFVKDGKPMVSLDEDYFTLFDDNKRELVKVSMTDGRVIFGDNANPNKAAIQFWKAVLEFQKCYNSFRR